jgi:hypothetical protein
MTRDEAIQAAQQMGLNNGESISFQSDGQIMHPHHHAGQTSGPRHVDYWKVTNKNGTYVAERRHSDD